MNYKYLIDIVSAGLRGDIHKVETVASILYRSLQAEKPAIAAQLRSLVANSASADTSLRRTPQPIPNSQLSQPNDSLPELVKLSDFSDALPEKPILSELNESIINNFLEERRLAQELLNHGVKPSSSLLFTGAPGTGKTMLARYLAGYLRKPLVTLDLSGSISSLLGKTGSNIKKVLDYAKAQEAVLLLDEFDAIAKKRDDSGELGEIKRIVNVLLIEMENWPPGSVLIATSNHPELLDRAVWRRFDHALELAVPLAEQRLHLIERQFATFLPSHSKEAGVLQVMANFLEDQSPADICRIATNVKRRMILKKEDLSSAAVRELCIAGKKRDKGKIIVIAKEVLGDAISVRELAELTGLSSSGVQHHLTK